MKEAGGSVRGRGHADDAGAMPFLRMCPRTISSSQPLGLVTTAPSLLQLVMGRTSPTR